MIKKTVLSSPGLSAPQIALIVVVGFLAVSMAVLMAYSYVTGAKTATGFEDAGYATTNLSNIQRESLLLRVETRALFHDSGTGVQTIEISKRTFESIELRRDFLTAQLRVAEAQASGNSEVLTELDSLRSYLKTYDALLAAVQSTPKMDHSVEIAEIDEVLGQLTLQVKSLYDRQEIRFFDATGAALRTQRSSQTLLLAVSAAVLGLTMVLALSLRQSVRTAFNRACDALETEVEQRRRVEQAQFQVAEENKSLAKIGLIISSSLDINEVYEQLGEEVRKLIPFDRMSLTLVDKERTTVTTSWTIGPEISGRSSGDSVPLKGALAEEVIHTKVPVMHVADSESDLRRRYPGLLPQFHAGIRTFLAAPLIYRDAAIGVLTLHSKEYRIYSQRHQDLALQIGGQIAGGLANSQLYAGLEKAEDRMRIANESLESQVQERTQAEEAALVSERKYRTLVNESPDMIFVSRIDDFRVTEVNDRACEHYGYTREEFLEITIFDLETDPPIKQEVRSLYDQTRVGHVVEVYGTNKRKDGSTFPVHVRFTKLDHELAIANVRDITQQRQEEQMRKQWSEETEVLAEIGRVISSSLDIQELYDLLCEPMQTLIPFDRMSLTLFDLHGNSVFSTATSDSEASSRRLGDILSAPGSLAGEVSRTHSPILFEAETAAELQERFPGLMDSFNAGMRTFLAQPLFYRDSLIGVLQIQSTTWGIYSLNHLDLAARVGSQIAGAIENARLYEQTRQAEEQLRIANETLEGRVEERTQEMREINATLKEEIGEHTKTEEDLNRSREQLRALTARLQSIREEERTALSREIHDELGQALTGMKLDLSWISKRLNAEHRNGSYEAVHEHIDSISETIDSTIQSVRTISTNLKPGVLDSIGLEAAVEWQANEFQTRTGIETRVHLPPHDHNISQDRSTSIFRILQEALTNVTRHSHATSVSIKLRHEGANLILEVEDNGIGINQSDISDLGAIGLLGMRERALQFGGEVTFLGAPGHGTIVKAWVPVGGALGSPILIPDE